MFTVIKQKVILAIISSGCIEYKRMRINVTMKIKFSIKYVKIFKIFFEQYRKHSRVS